jgi:pSer/pThr/pTyr-binding forkhead associated (FHA) protein
MQQNSSTSRLVVLHGERPNAIYRLNQNQNYIGRDENNTITLSDTQVSKKHAAITSGYGTFWIEDMKSKNGIFLNGKRVKKREKLVHGCLVKLGSTILRFETMPIT